MAMGRRKREQQDSLFVMASGLPRSPGHPFYRKLNELLAGAGFDRWIEERCERYYATAQYGWHRFKRTRAQAGLAMRSAGRMASSSRKASTKLMRKGSI
jgi:hypothetical protein